MTEAGTGGENPPPVPCRRHRTGRGPPPKAAHSHPGAGSGGITTIRRSADPEVATRKPHRKAERNGTGHPFLSTIKTDGIDSAEWDPPGSTRRGYIC